MACMLKYLGGNLPMLAIYFEMPHKNKMVWWMLEGWIDIWQSKYSKMLILESRWRISRYSLHLFQFCCIVAIFHNEIIKNSTYNIKLLYLLHFFSVTTHIHQHLLISQSPTSLPLLALLQSPGRSRPWSHTWAAEPLSSLLSFLTPIHPECHWQVNLPSSKLLPCELWISAIWAKSP